MADAELALKLFALSETPQAVAHVLTSMDASGIQLTCSHIHQLIRCHALSGNTAAMEQALQLLAAAGYTPNEDAWHTIITAYSECDPAWITNRVERILDLFLVNNCTNTGRSAFTAGAHNSGPEHVAQGHVKHHHKNRHHHHHRKQKQQQQQQQPPGMCGTGLDDTITPQVAAYHSALSAARNLQLVDVARLVLRHATQHLPFPPPLLLWNQLAWCHALCKDPASVRRLIEEMEQQGIEHDSTTLAFLLMAHGRAWQIDQAFAIYKQLLQDPEDAVDETVFICVMDVLAHSAQSREARAVFDQMKRSGIVPSVTAYNKLVKAYAHSRSPELARRTVLSMRRAGVQPNATTFRCWLYGYAIARDTEGAEDLMQHMASCGLRPCAQTYNVLLYCYALAGEVALARTVIDRMIEDGEKPLTVSFNILANGLGRQHNIEGLRALVSDMAAARVRPNVVTYNTLIKAFCMNHQIDKAEQMLTRMIETGLMGDEATWGALAGAYARKGSVDDLIFTIRRSIAGGCIPNRQMYDMVAHLLSNCSTVSDAARQDAVQTIATMIVEAAQGPDGAVAPEHEDLVRHCFSTGRAHQ